MEAGPASYQPPVDRLLWVGDPRADEERSPERWRAYRALRLAENDEESNACIIDFLLPLKAVEAAEVIERAYAAGREDEVIFGTWEEVRRELGVAGLGLVTKDSPRNPNSLRNLLRSMRRPKGAGGYGEVVRA